jgi:hypothetical protein
MNDGIYNDLSIEDYHGNHTHISATQIKYARQSIKHFQYYISGKLPREEKTHFDFGNAFELALLAPKEYLEKVAISPDMELVSEILSDGVTKNARNTNRYKEKMGEFLNANKGKYIIHDTGSESFETIEEMLSSCYQDKIIQGLIKNTEYQLSLFWTDPQTGLKLKTRPDFCKRKKNVIVNLKTTLNGSPEAFSKDLKKYDYPIQAAIEIQGCLKTGVMDRVDNYFWLVVEKVPPYNATIYEFAERDIAAVTDTLDFLLSRIKKAKESNLYPGYTDAAENEYGILTAQIPLWYRY